MCILGVAVLWSLVTSSADAWAPTYACVDDNAGVDNAGVDNTGAAALTKTVTIRGCTSATTNPSISAEIGITRLIREIVVGPCGKAHFAGIEDAIVSVHNTPCVFAPIFSATIISINPGVSTLRSRSVMGLTTISVSCGNMVILRIDVSS